VLQVPVVLAAEAMAKPLVDSMQGWVSTGLPSLLFPAPPELFCPPAWTREEEVKRLIKVKI
jgi:hypothetical protein